jgi:hypothetical protein
MPRKQHEAKKKHDTVQNWGEKSEKTTASTTNTLY